MIKRFAKMLSMVLSVALLLWCTPFAYAEQSNLTISQQQKGVLDSLESSASSVSVIDNELDDHSSTPVVSGDSSDDSRNIENDKNNEISDDALGDEDTGIDDDLSLFSVIGSAYIYQVDLEQQRDTTEVTVSLPNADALMASNKVDRLVIEATMSHDGKITRNVVADRMMSTLADSQYSFTMDMKTYGKFTVSAKFYKNNVLVQQGDSQTLGVVSQQYNIAPVSASLPVAFFSLSLWGENSIRYSDDGSVIPTIMLMERPAAYNWDNLPEGVYGLPYLSEAEIAYQPDTFNGASELFRQNAPAMAEYVGDLYELNPSATFHLYVVDFYVGLIQSILYANGIPESQYTITVLSDGSFSYQQFSNVYGGSDPSTTHDALIEKWNEAKAQAYTTGEVSDGYWMWQPNNALYAAVASEPHAQWWLARPALLTTAGDDGVFGQRAQSDTKIVRINIAQMLSQLEGQGGDAVQGFKSLYNFSDTYFADARDAGKKIMLFLGTTVTGEAGSFSDYARFTMEYYGDEYSYYYKGHPGTPTDFYPEKQDELDALGVTDVDSSIAAELILFFNPDIYLSGYTSSTYASVSDSMAKGLFRKSKADALADTTSDYSIMDFFMSPVDGNTIKSIRDLCQEGDKSYLIEFSDDLRATIDYDIALWNSSTSTISYYALRDGGYQFVRSQQGGSNLVDGGAYVLRSVSFPEKVVDINGASRADEGKIQIWSDNASVAQTFRLAHVGGGYYTIQNVNSGKVLDVAGAAQDPGAKVWQYSSNGSDAQKWKLVETGDDDGSYHLISKCNGLSLDIEGNGSADGTGLQVYSSNGTSAQKFFLDKIQQYLPNGQYEIKTSLDSSKVLDVNGGSLWDSAKIQIYESNFTGAQRFEVSFDVSSGYYSIVNIVSNRALDVAGGSASSGSAVWQYSQNGTAAQKWRVEPLDEGGYLVVSGTGNGCCLDVVGGNTDNGAQVQIYTPNGTNAQKWVFAAA